MPKELANGRITLSIQEAFALLPDGEYIHTFRQAGNALLGADWERREILKAFNKYEVEVTGEHAQSIGHGVAFCDEHGWVFVETKR